MFFKCSMARNPQEKCLDLWLCERECQKGKTGTHLFPSFVVMGNIAALRFLVVRNTTPVDTYEVCIERLQPALVL